MTEYISDLFKHIDSDGSGQVEYQELKEYVDDSMEVQNFILRYSGVQTIRRAKIVFAYEQERWLKFFNRISVDYFGDQFVEMAELKKQLEKEMADQPALVRKRIVQMFMYDGKNVVNEQDFMRVLIPWSAFTANDINNDGALDSREIEKLIWLVTQR